MILTNVERNECKVISIVLCTIIQLEYLITGSYNIVSKMIKSVGAHIHKIIDQQRIEEVNILIEKCHAMIVDTIVSDSID